MLLIRLQRVDQLNIIERSSLSVLVESGITENSWYGVDGKVFQVSSKVNELIQMGSEISSNNDLYGDPNVGSRLKYLHLEFKSSCWVNRRGIMFLRRNGKFGTLPAGMFRELLDFF